jgi:hypothetical protein
MSRVLLDAVRSPGRRPGVCLAGGIDSRAGVHQKGDNQTIQTQDFSENENQNHSDIESGLLSCSANTCVTDNTNGKTSCHTSQTDSETSSELNESSVQRNLLTQIVCNQDRDDQPVDTNDTGHDNGDNVLDNQVRSEDSHSTNTDTSLGGTIGGSEAGEDDGGGATQRTEEGLDSSSISDHIVYLRRNDAIRCVEDGIDGADVRVIARALAQKTRGNSNYSPHRRGY